MRLVKRLALSAAGLSIASVTLAAQSSPPDTLTRPPSGPDAAVPQAPPFAVPTPNPLPPAPPGLPPAANPTADLRIERVEVTGTAPAPARPRAAWAPGTDPVTGLTITHRLGEALDAAWVERQFTANDLVGRAVTQDRVAALMQLINIAFAENGFINSGVLIRPDAGDGVLRLALILGSLATNADSTPAISVTFAGGKTRGLSSAYIRNRLPAATARPLSVTALEREFRLLTDDPAIRTVAIDVRPGTAPGQALLDVTVDPQPRIDLFVEAANSRSPSVGAERISIGGSIRNALTPGDIVTAEYGNTKGLDDVYGGYRTQFLSRHIFARFTAGYNSAAVVSRPLLPLDISSREWFVEGGLGATLTDRPLLPSGRAAGWKAAQTATLTLLVAHHQIKSELFGQPFSFSPGSVNGRTEYTALRMAADYTRRSPRAALAASLTGVVGLEGTRAPIAGQPDQHFVALLAQVNYAYRLTPKQLELRLRFAGQLAGGVLYSSERLAIGGTNSVRGYRENLLLADEGAVGAIELAQRLDLTPRTRSDVAFDWGLFTSIVFVDGALARNRVDPQPVPRRLASVGAGLDWTPAPWLYARVTYARALNRIDIAGKRDLQDRGVAFRVVLRPLGLVKALL